MEKSEDQKIRNKIHCLKTWTKSFHDVERGLKKFEIRKNDRNFAVGDLLILQEYDGAPKQYTGEMIAVRITYIVTGEYGLPKDMCVMGVEYWNQ